VRHPHDGRLGAPDVVARRVGRQRAIGIQERVEPLDAGQEGVDDLDGQHTPAGDVLGSRNAGR
jgi:hypothetical protein